MPDKRPQTQPTTIILSALGAFALALIALITSQVNAGPHHPEHRHRGEADRSGDRGRLIVHEWGTFTSVQGSSGVELDGMQHEGELLPDFVHAFATAVPSPFRPLGDPSHDMPVRRTRSKMETPVIYFHTDRARDLTVEVGFVKGLMSHYYPAPTRMAPAPRSGHRPHPTVDLSRLEYSFLEWRARVIPEASVDASRRPLPAVARDNHYGFARDVDAARVRVKSTLHGDQDERFLFYRGLGHGNPDIQVVSSDNRATRLHNRAAGALPAAFAVEMTGRQGRFVSLGEVARGADVSFDLASARFAGKKTVIAALSRRMVEVLVARGLYRDEARAMVKTWAHQWFGERGTRVLYIVPDEYVDRTLPMRITPAPDKILRVFVGRIEYLAPAAEADILSDLEASNAADAATWDRAMRRLAAQGRFLEPKLRRARVIARDPALRARASALLETMEAGIH